MEIKKLKEETIKEYGRIIQGDYFEPLLEKMQRVEYPAEGVEYVMSSEELEEKAVKRKVEETIYGGVPVQIGYCIGKNKRLNALEYHRSPEINIAVDDMILLLGRLQDVEMDFSYDTSRLEAFYVPAGHCGGTLCNDASLCTMCGEERYLQKYRCFTERYESDPCV